MSETSGCSRIVAPIAVFCQLGAAKIVEVPPPDPDPGCVVPGCANPPLVFPQAVMLATSCPNSLIGAFTPPTEVTFGSPDGQFTHTCARYPALPPRHSAVPL